MPLLECVANVSEGRDEEVLARAARSCGQWLVDLHRDAWHHRAVFTLAGPPAAVELACRRLARFVVRSVDLRSHQGVHPRLGALDVVPFVALNWLPVEGRVEAGPDLGPATAARDRFAHWAAATLGVPCFLYGPLDSREGAPDGSGNRSGEERALPEVRRDAFGRLEPDMGPLHPHPTAGAIAVGARPLLVAYNVWLGGCGVRTARRIAAAIRSPAVRALGFDIGGVAQVSCNLVEPASYGPAEVYDEVARLAALAGAGPVRGELVGLLPASVLQAVPERRWPELGLAATATLEARLAAAFADVSPR